MCVNENKSGEVKVQWEAMVEVDEIKETKSEEHVVCYKFLIHDYQSNIYFSWSRK